MGNFKSFLTLYNLLTDTISLTKLDRIILDILATHPVHGNNKVYVCGNGGSFATAQHFAQDLCKINQIDAECLGSNPSQLTAYANDNGYSNALVDELDNKVVRDGDMLIVISCSGNSMNTIKVAYSMAGLSDNMVIGLLGGDGGEVAQYCAETIIIPSKRFDFIEPIHSLLCHYIVTEIKERLLYA